MDALTLVAMIGFVAQFLIWLGLPENPAEKSAMSALPEPEAMAA